MMLHSQDRQVYLRGLSKDTLLREVPQLYLHWQAYVLSGEQEACLFNTGLSMTYLWID